jgi:UDP-N-acetylglucosamine:LPS N-acetylglucosamine transferase
MKMRPIQNIDILNNFVLHEGLSFAEMLVYNYATKFRSKDDIIGHCRVFFTKLPIRNEYDRLVNHFKILREFHENGKITVQVVTQFEKNIVKVEVFDRK